MPTAFSLHATLQNFAGSLLRAVYRPIVEVAEESRRLKQPVIYAANHIGYMDGPMLLCAIDQPVHVITKFEVFTSALGVLLRRGGAVPVYWNGADRRALRHSVNKLLNGEAVALFTEGARCRGRHDWIRDGVSYLVANTGASVVPIAVLGTRHTGQHKEMITPLHQQTAVIVGAPISASELLIGTTTSLSRSELSQLGERIRQRLQAFTLEAESRVGIVLPEDDVSLID